MLATEHWPLARDPHDPTALIHEQSQGRLRDTDRIATDALKLGARRKIKTVDRKLVARVLSDADVFSDD